MSARTGRLALARLLVLTSLIVCALWPQTSALCSGDALLAAQCAPPPSANRQRREQLDGAPPAEPTRASSRPAPAARAGPHRRRALLKPGRPSAAFAGRARSGRTRNSRSQLRPASQPPQRSAPAAAILFPGRLASSGSAEPVFVVSFLLLFSFRPATTSGSCSPRTQASSLYLDRLFRAHLAPAGSPFELAPSRPNHTELLAHREHPLSCPSEPMSVSPRA